MRFFIIYIALILVSGVAYAGTRGRVDVPGSGNKQNTMELNRNFALDTIQYAMGNATRTDNTQEWRYEKKVTFPIRTREWMQTVIELPENEHIEDYIIGDEGNFVLEPLRYLDANGNLLRNVNKCVVYGLRPVADTNFTLLGESGNDYKFYIINDPIDSPYPPDFYIYIVDPKIRSFVSKYAPGSDKEAKPKKMNYQPLGQETDVPDYLRKVTRTPPELWNFDYQVDPADHSLAPKQIFDDGVFTYFLIGENGNMDRVTKLPLFYKSEDGHDRPVQIEMSGDYVVAKTRSKNWTVRSGDFYVCIRQKPKK